MKTPNHTSLVLGFVLLITSFSSASMASGCFDPRDVPAIQQALAPNARYKETVQSVEQIHQLIWSYRHQIDPRLVYYRILGESGGNPFAENPSSGAYGLVQFLGRPYRSPRTHRQLIEAQYRARPNTSVRLIQIEYYLTQYLQLAARAADGGYGCNRSKDFDEYTNMEKVTYLGWGSCNSNAVSSERGLCRNVHTYRTVACPLFAGVVEGRDRTPLCD